MNVNGKRVLFFYFGIFFPGMRMVYHFLKLDFVLSPLAPWPKLSRISFTCGLPSIWKDSFKVFSLFVFLFGMNFLFTKALKDGGFIENESRQPFLAAISNLEHLWNGSGCSQGQLPSLSGEQTTFGIQLKFLYSFCCRISFFSGQKWTAGLWCLLLSSFLLAVCSSSVAMTQLWLGAMFRFTIRWIISQRLSVCE